MKPFACSEKRYSKKYKTKDVKILIEAIKNNNRKNLRGIGESGFL